MSVDENDTGLANRRLIRLVEEIDLIGIHPSICGNFRSSCVPWPGRSLGHALQMRVYAIVGIWGVQNFSDKER